MYLDSQQTFSAPPLDGSLTIPQIYDWHYKHNPDYPVFVYAGSNDGQLHYIRYSGLVPAMHEAGRYVAASTNTDVEAHQSTYPIVALLSTADTVTTYTTLLGMMRLGIVAVPISPRFSASVIAHLLAKTGASYIFVSVERRLHDLARDAIATLTSRDPDHEIPTICAMPQFSQLYKPDMSFESLPRKGFELSSPSLVVHSSCSTSEYPKAIPWTVRLGMQQALIPITGSHNLTGHVFGCHSLEPFHGIGLLFLFYIPSSGLIMSTFEPTSPAITPTPEAVFRAYTQVNPTYVLAPTRFMEEWARDSSKVQFLCTLKGVLSGGKMLRKTVGDYLAEEGVSLRNMYGSTESGHISAVPSAHQGLDWEFFEVSSQCTTKFLPIGDGSFHAVTLATPTYTPPILNTQVNGQDAYASGDLFVPHPHKLGLWKFLGRMDSQIMLSNGHVVNSARLEDRLCDHSHIAGTVIFGQARSRLGAVVELKPDFAFDVEDLHKLIAFRDSIWPDVEKLNASVPRHCYISKEMILVASRSKPFVYNQKGTPRRPFVLLQYQPEIDALYGSPANDILYENASHEISFL